MKKRVYFTGLFAVGMSLFLNGCAILSETNTIWGTGHNGSTLKMQGIEKQSEPMYTDDELLILVNADHPVPEEWDCELVELRNDQKIDARAYEDLQAMMDDARAEGLEPLICSSWRSSEFQEELFEEEVEKYISQGYTEDRSKKLAAEWVAMPGTSEHELGLAVDIVSVHNQRLEKNQEDTPEQQWLMEHCHEYGFILRYPEDKEEITGIGYEPWHYRYVGKEAAKAIMAQGVCLEEYLANEP